MPKGASIQCPLRRKSDIRLPLCWTEVVHYLGTKGSTRTTSGQLSFGSFPESVEICMQELERYRGDSITNSFKFNPFDIVRVKLTANDMEYEQAIDSADHLSITPYFEQTRCVRAWV